MQALNNPEFPQFVHRLAEEPLERIFPLADDEFGRLVLWHYDQYPLIYKGNLSISLSMAMHHGIAAALKELQEFQQQQNQELALKLDEC